VDFKLPDLSGIGVARRVSSENLDRTVLVYTAYGTAHLLSEAIAAGARGLVKKDAPIEKVLRAFAMVCAGRPYIEPSLASALVHRRGMRSSLSTQELSVLQLLAAGHTMEQISTQLTTTVDSVQNHVHSLMPKLDAATRSEAVATALRAELIS
jgi:DNA-binding NarL/FixJ family response regulator